LEKWEDNSKSNPQQALGLFEFKEIRLRKPCANIK
jgi:hypothetical protein